MGKLSEWLRRLLGYSPPRLPYQPPDSVAPKIPIQPSQPEETQLRSGDSEPIREVAPRILWQERGKHLQATDVAAGSRTRPVYLGVDFGTAFTKVAVRTAGYVFFIRWDKLIGDGLFGDKRYLLPGRLSTTKNGASVPGIGQFQALKEPLLPGNVAGEDDQVRAVEFLSAVMRFARAWLFENHPNLVRTYSLAWNLRIGCPTNLFEADYSKDLYRRLAAVAWVASQTDYLPTGKDVRRILKEGGTDTDTGLDGLEAIPEFVAQITSYSHSPQRVDGLHLLVDCGAGTVDVVSFNVFRHPNRFENRYQIWSSDLQPKGTRFLMERYLGNLSQWDPDAPVPEQAELQDRFGVERARLLEVDRSFRAGLSHIIYNALCHTKHRRTPLALAWQTGLPVFVCGGGSVCRVYLDSVTTGCRQIPITPLLREFPLPENLTQDISPDLFHRLSVAYGLTLDSGSYYAASEEEDFTRPTASGRSRPDRDELYPK